MVKVNGWYSVWTMAIKWVIGIDEAGRGPLAGPVSVGVVLVPVDFDWALVPGVNDSKQLSEGKREEIYKITQKLSRAGVLHYAVSMSSAKMIDTKGIVPAVTQAMNRALRSVSKSSTRSRLELDLQRGTLCKSSIPSSRQGLELNPGEVLVKLDGGLKAPAEYVYQETIIKGDAKERVIGLASIMAKVTRDRYMVARAKEAQYQVYDFARHKGYGTVVHRIAIAKNGLSPEHRASYCKNIESIV
jgi:ribonuclease HII